MKYAILFTVLLLLQGCITYIYSPKSIKITSPDAHVTLGEADTETFTQTEIEKFGQIKD